MSFVFIKQFVWTNTALDGNQADAFADALATGFETKSISSSYAETSFTHSYSSSASFAATDDLFQ